MRLTIPEPKIELYKDGFDGHDQLGRKETGDKLSDLVERIDDPLVIALDGAWGSGKSFFLKCWVGAHLKREGNTTHTVYFDAFKHDFLDDPLIALTGAIAERFRNPEAEQEAREKEEASARRAKFKKSAWAVSKAAGRIGLSAVTFGATEILSDMGDEVAKAASDEAKALLNSKTGDAESEKFWDMHQARIAAMEAFRLALTDLTDPVTDEEAERYPELKAGTPKRKLVIVIDELDRCRPDYALSLLEIIKHFFNVDGVHFVLGVNLKELQNSVRARYGIGVDAETYLQKFVTMGMTLNHTSNEHSSNPIWAEHFQNCAAKMEFPEEAKPLLKTTELILSRFKLTRDHSLRDVERVLTALAALPNLRNRLYLDVEVSIGTMAVLKVLQPTAYHQYLRPSKPQFNCQQHFEVSTEEYDRHGELIVLVWRAIQNIDALSPEEKADVQRESSSRRNHDWEKLLGKSATKYLEVFDLTGF